LPERSALLGAVLAFKQGDGRNGDIPGRMFLKLCKYFRGVMFYEVRGSLILELSSNDEDPVAITWTSGI